jgi:hypothetical protein
MGVDALEAGLDVERQSADRAGDAGLDQFSTFFFNITI